MSKSWKVIVALNCLVLLILALLALEIRDLRNAQSTTTTADRQCAETRRRFEAHKKDDILIEHAVTSLQADVNFLREKAELLEVSRGRN